jgi:hypothetical protein
MQDDPPSFAGVHIQHSAKPGERYIALWGSGAGETVEAVEKFVTSELLDEFLASIWES